MFYALFLAGMMAALSGLASPAVGTDALLEPSSGWSAPESALQETEAYAPAHLTYLVELGPDRKPVTNTSFGGALHSDSGVLTAIYRLDGQRYFKKLKYDGWVPFFDRYEDSDTVVFVSRSDYVIIGGRSYYVALVRQGGSPVRVLGYLSAGADKH